MQSGIRARCRNDAIPPSLLRRKSSRGPVVETDSVRPMSVTCSGLKDAFEHCRLPRSASTAVEHPRLGFLAKCEHEHRVRTPFPLNNAVGHASQEDQAFILERAGRAECMAWLEVDPSCQSSGNSGYVEGDCRARPLHMGRVPRRGILPEGLSVLHRPVAVCQRRNTRLQRRAWPPANRR